MRSRLGAAGSALKTDPVVMDIAKEHSCDPCAVTLAWGNQTGHSVIPKVGKSLLTSPKQQRSYFC